MRRLAKKAVVAATMLATTLAIGVFSDRAQASSMQTFSMQDFAPVLRGFQQPPFLMEPAAAQSSDIPAGMMIVQKSVSPDFIREIEGVSSTLPANALRALAKAGYKIELSHTVTDAVPSARNQQVRGYEPHSTWDSVYGMFNRSSRKVVMAEYAQVSNGLGGKHPATLTNAQRRQGIMRHEFGHAIDDYLGNFSHSAAFRAAYAKGKATVSRQEASVLSYYLQSGDAGAEETFAELFASMDGTGCDRSSDILLQNHFGELVGLIRNKLATISG